ncbi:uncharacterized protein K02A2.6-like [Topomyia yanbarensis]|uniref:uncharacterized protein K02A2.6-like n=1 Tax=Topomyia yanbarensis TaxID=2498891 RepID=UPI00273B8A32|nr:uncharacterized protein K02A2.6-like [Topomyia yanbarensis]
MLLNLQRYNLSIEFVTGKDNVVADAISRAPFDDHAAQDDYKKHDVYKLTKEIEKLNLTSFLKVSDKRLDEIIDETTNDQSMQLIIDFINRGWPSSIDRVPDGVKIYFSCRDELSTQNGIIFRNDRILVPHNLRRKLIDSCHISHNGIESALKLARANLFWPGMTSQITDVVKECPICAKYSASQPNPPMLTHSIPVYPFQLVSMDVFFADYRGCKCKWLVTVDHYSDFFEVNNIKDLTPESVIMACQQNFARHGKPQRILTDNGSNFVNSKMVKFASDWDIEHVTSAPHHQQANGKAEAAVKIAKRLLKKAEETGADFWYALLHWRNIPNKIGSSPASRLFSRAIRCGVPTAISNLLPKVVKDVPEMIENNRKKAKYQYDKRTRNLPDIQTGSPVYVQLNSESSNLWTPGTISKRFNERSYLVDVNGAEYRRSLVNLKPRKESLTLPNRFEPSVQHSSLTNFQSLEEHHPAGSDDVRSRTVNFPTACQPTSENTSTTIELLESPSSSQPVALPRGQPCAAVLKRPIDAPIATCDVSNARPRRLIKLPKRLKDYQVEYK